MVKLSVNIVTGLILTLIITTTIFLIIGDTARDMGDAAANVTGASDTLPLTSFFKPKGVILLSFMAGITITLILAYLAIGKSK